MKMIDDGGDLYSALESLNLLEQKPPMWWPHYGTFEVIVGAILTQNAQWTKVETSLQNLRDHDYLSMGAITSIDLDRFMEYIRPSGLYKNKAKYLNSLCQNMLKTYGDFETFCVEVDREWLLTQKGIGPETADSILCYACQRPAMVVDAYTARLLSALGYEMESYEDLQLWCRNGIMGDDETLAKTYALFHGMIVEYVKRYKRGKQVDIEALT